MSFSISLRWWTRRNDALLASKGLPRTEMFSLPSPGASGPSPLPKGSAPTVKPGNSPGLATPIPNSPVVSAPTEPAITAPAIKEPVPMSDVTKFIIDPLESTLAPVAVPVLQEFTQGFTQLVDNLLAKAGTVGAIATPEVNLTLALASAIGSNILATKLGTATTPAQLPAAA